MPKIILVPTDFSDSAFSAAIFASNLAQAKGYDIHLYHYYTISSSLFEDENSENEQREKSLFKADVQMSELKNKLIEKYPSINCHSTCERGLLQEKLPIVAQSTHFELIVMGTQGTSKNKSILYGSNTSAMTSKSPIPVMAIPINALPTVQTNKVALLTNFRTEEIETLIEYIRIVHTIDQLYLIHVGKDDKNGSEIKERLESWSFNIKEINGINNVTIIYDEVSPDDEELDTVPEVINNHILRHNIDMLLVTKTRKSFFEKIFSSSVSKQLVLDLKTPTFFDRI